MSKSVLQTIKSLLGSDERYRGNCPFCNGKNTLSISNEGGQLKWYCFRASCTARGISETERTVKHIARKLSEATTETEFKLPDYFTNVLSNQDAVSYIRKNNCVRAVASRNADIRYDPRLNRVVFVTTRNNVPVAASGRALRREDNPKWYHYDRRISPFICGSNKDLAIVVEDPPSACAVSHMATGIALMGTRLNLSLVPELKHFNEVWVCLDPDATRKALDIAKTISYYTNTRVVPIKDDLKYLSENEVKHFVEKHNGR